MTPSVSLPPGWQDQTVYLYKGPERKGVQHYLRLMIDPEVKQQSLEAFGRLRSDTMLHTLPRAEVITEGVRDLPSGIRTYELVYKQAISENVVRFTRVYFLQIDGVGYTFSCDFSKYSMKTVGVEVESIVDTFAAQTAGVEEQD
jgi:hypothetical protein